MFYAFIYLCFAKNKVHWSVFDFIPYKIRLNNIFIFVLFTTQFSIKSSFFNNKNLNAIACNFDFNYAMIKIKVIFSLLSLDMQNHPIMH